MIDVECDPLLRGVFAAQLKRLDAQILAFGAWEDHVHVLFDLGPAASVSTAFRAMKGASALALSKRLALRFLWQEGYAAFAVERANVPTIAEYVNHQRHRHATAALTDELEAALDEAHAAPRLLTER